MKFLTNEPVAPWWWKRAENAGIFMFTGAIPIVGLVEGMNDVLKQNLTMVVLPLLTLAVKTFGILLGDSAARPVNPEQKQQLTEAEQNLQQKWTDEKDANKTNPK